MAYNQGGDRGGFRGGDRGGRPSFGGPKRWGGNDRGGRDDRPTEMFKAVCSECGKTCEVPFRPSGDKPVFCNECFGKKKGDTGTAPRNDRARPDESFGRGPRMDFAPRPPAHAPVGGDPMHKQMEAINSKLDRLIKLMEGTAVVKPAKVENVKPWEKTTAPVKVANAPELKALLDRAMDKPAKKSAAKPVAKKTVAKKPARSVGGAASKTATKKVVAKKKK